MNPHSKATYLPEDYEFVSVYFQGRAGSEEYDDMVAAYLSESSPESWDRAQELLEKAGREEGSPCDHCGARFKFGAVLLHKPTGKGIAVGRQCFRQDFDFIRTRAEYDFRRLDEFAARARKRAAFWKRVREENLEEAICLDHRTVRSIRQRGEKYGKLSEAQAKLVRKLHAETRPVVVGKGEITGEVLKVTTREYRRNQWSPTEVTLKVTVKDDRGFVVWGTLAAKLEETARKAVEEYLGNKQTIEWLKGKRIRFKATVEAREAGFGIFKRPSGGEVL